VRWKNVSDGNLPQGFHAGEERNCTL